MNTLLIYMIKTTAYSAAFYMVYHLLLSPDTQHSRNRAYLLVSMIASAVLPFLVIRTSEPIDFQVFGKTLPEILISAEANIVVARENFTLANILPVLYLAGILFFLSRSLATLLRIAKLTRDENRSKIIRQRRLGTAGFSVLKWIVIDADLADDEAREIIRHEQLHINKRHYLDLLILELLVILQWYNPFIYLLGKALREVHEFQADMECTSSGISTSDYQNLILSQVFGVNLIGLSSNFSGKTLIKKRIMMMTKKRSGKLANLKIFMVIPVIATLLLAFSSCRDKSDASGTAERKVEMTQQASSAQQAADAPPPPPVPGSEEKKVIKGQPVPEDAPPPPPPPPPYTIKDGDTIWVMVQEMPRFKEKDGDAQLLKFIRDNTKYPPEAKEKGIQGRVIVRFAVEKDGSVSNATVLKGTDPQLDAEALRVVKTLPDFEAPGYNKNKPVMVWYMVPITFALK